MSADAFSTSVCLCLPSLSVARAVLTGSRQPPDGYQWGDASVLVLDLSSPRLLALSKALAPGILRIGGSPIDSIEYAMHGEACARGIGTCDD
eukprot:SAG22_NODE_1113_length_5533_cov_5.884063_8_plen_92_part_00